MTTCDRCRKRPACCVVGATIDYIDGVEPVGGYERMPLDVAAMIHLYGQRGYGTYSTYAALCPVCSGRL